MIINPRTIGMNLTICRFSCSFLSEQAENQKYICVDIMKAHYSRDLPAARLAQLAPGADGHPREDGDQQRAPGGGAGPSPPAHIERYLNIG